MFVDIAKIYVKGGDGGNGIISFHREKYIAAGGPDGGDGGRGGNVVFYVDEGLSTLADFKYRRKYIADSGKNGGSSQKTGKSGEDLLIKVPQGTVVKDFKTGQVLADMTEKGVKRIIARGGKGGAGNQHFATSTRQIPSFSKTGKPGEEYELQLELKLLADVGLVGLPNVGKSTLLSVTTDAKPEIADYHFTTIQPNLGVVRLAEERSFVMADIPGLIEGASQGLGLGYEFLRHIERTRLIIHIIDMGSVEGRKPFEDFLLINKELREYNPVLADRPQIIAANKMDMPGSDEILRDFKIKLTGWLAENNFSVGRAGDIELEGVENWRIFAISAAIAEGTGQLMNYAFEMLSKLPELPKINVDEDKEAFYGLDEGDTVTINVDANGVYNVEGNWIKQLVGSVNLDSYESTQYFQRVIRKKGLIKELEDLGICEGDTVKIYNIEFNYVK